MLAQAWAIRRIKNTGRKAAEMENYEESAQNKQQMKPDGTVKYQWARPKYLPVGRTTVALSCTKTLLTSEENRFTEGSCYYSSSRGG